MNICSREEEEKQHEAEWEEEQKKQAEEAFERKRRHNVRLEKISAERRQEEARSSTP